MNSIIIFSAKYLLYLLAVIAIVFGLQQDFKTRKKILSLSAISSILAIIITGISSRIISDPRPFVVQNVQPLLQHAADNGFPSDHTLLAALIAFVIYDFNRKTGVWLFVFTIIIGLSRVAALVHHPLDITGSILIAFVSVSLAIKIISTTSHS